MLFQLVVPVIFGLEGVCADEMRKLDLPNVQAQNGRVLCEFSPAGIVRANLGLRTGERVLLRLGRFPAPNFDALFNGTRGLPWEDFLSRESAFPVKGHCLNSTLHSVPACQSIIKKAVASRLGQKFNRTLFPETGPVFQIQFQIFKNEAELFFDTTGPSLHKRGYRAVGVSAPLRETLAAGMVLLSRYRGRSPFRDPFCGSGTIPIEAALIAKNRAPGLDRTFSAQKWDWIPQKIWLDEAERAMDLEFDNDYDICGSDIDPQAVAVARSNAQKAGVEDLVQFSEADALHLRLSESEGRMVTNPPYGERLLDPAAAEKLTADFGKTWKTVPPGWSLSLLSAHHGFERVFGQKADKRRKLYNGRIPCTLFQYWGNREDPS